MAALATSSGVERDTFVGASSAKSHNERRHRTAQRASLVEETIRIMDECGTTLHPVHSHSFQQISFLLSFQTHKCVSCEERISVLSGGVVRCSLVKCLACGAVSHRACAMDYTRPAFQRWRSTDKHCSVNREHCQRRQQKEAESVDDCLESKKHHRSNLTQMITSLFTRDPLSEATKQAKGKWPDGDDAASLSRDSKMSIVDVIPRENDRERPFRPWDNPRHSSKEQSLHDADARTSIDVGDSGESMPSDQYAFHFPHQSFPNIARALQENVLANFQRRRSTLDRSSPTTTRRVIAPYPGHRAVALQRNEAASNDQSTANHDRSPSSMRFKDDNPIAKFADRTLGVVRNKVSATAVAGGIAGGIAGLAIAGPVGAYAGYYMAAAAGSSLMIGEATALGVVMAGIATGGITAQQIQGHMAERRILTMGEEGASRKVLLVRPNVKIDPIWEQICRDAKLSAPGQLLKGKPRSDSDIVQTAEEEIQTPDKVLLLVSRILNDRASRPGHVYRYLIDKFMDRCRARQELQETNSSISSTSPRARRDDAHAVIKHVTATLMEERPEFGSSPGLTELTATAVEGLVFGQIYESVFEEIVEETSELDVGLWRKITVFMQQRHQGSKSAALLEDLVSQQALDVLKLLPEAHSAADKLYYCVRFLDCIAEHFLANTSNNICADTLLKMVCQHLILIENQGSCNAQMVFLEEFVCDEQILSGRDGYALATLQASLHFLNASTDFDSDIFGDDVVNVVDLPVEPRADQTKPTEGETTFFDTDEG
jgi:Vacuolar sorting protein 9 (VPS9) domain